jgi:endonuclease/exonuclease/phosphatase family metal-dependent hydrolase
MGDLNMGSKLGKGRRKTHRSAEVFAAFADLGLVSAYHAFHQCDHGAEPHATYRHLFKRRQPWHIDFCFVPEAWKPALTNVTVIDSRAWARRSDHSPVQVDLTMDERLG